MTRTAKNSAPLICRCTKEKKVAYESYRHQISILRIALSAQSDTQFKFFEKFADIQSRTYGNACRNFAVEHYSSRHNGVCKVLAEAIV